MKGSTNPADLHEWQREDAKKLDEWDEQIATERFEEHEARKDESNGSGETDRPCAPDA